MDVKEICDWLDEAGFVMTFTYDTGICWAKVYDKNDTFQLKLIANGHGRSKESASERCLSRFHEVMQARMP